MRVFTQATPENVVPKSIAIMSASLGFSFATDVDLFPADTLAAAAAFNAAALRLFFFEGGMKDGFKLVSYVGGNDVE